VVLCGRVVLLSSVVLSFVVLWFLVLCCVVLSYVKSFCVAVLYSLVLVSCFFVFVFLSCVVLYRFALSCVVLWYLLLCCCGVLSFTRQFISSYLAFLSELSRNSSHWINSLRHVVDKGLRDG
jgi:hypothetical protein